MVQVTAVAATTETNAANLGAISEAVIFTATGERGLPAKILAEGGGSQYAKTGGQPLDPLTAVTYDSENNPVPDAVIAYVIEEGDAQFKRSSDSNNPNLSGDGKVLLTRADNNGRSAARPTLGITPGTVKISAYAYAPSTVIDSALIDTIHNGAALSESSSATAVGLTTYQIAVLQQSDGPTQFTGKVLDHTGKPLSGVRLSISRTALSVTTDDKGDFLFSQDVPPGKLDLFVDGRAVTGSTPLPAVGGNSAGSSPTQYPSLHFEALAIRGQKNQLAHPIYLPPILMSQAKIVGGDKDVSLTIPGREGFEMIVKANSVTFPDGSKIGPLVVSPVADDRLPMSPPGGVAGFMPSTAATLQPSGTRFDPPIEVRLPNTSGYQAGERVAIYHWDHDIGQFVAMGQATVTEDRAQLITDPGSGITKAGWHGPSAPPPPPDCGVGPPPKCDDLCQEAKTTIVNGCRQTTCAAQTIGSLDITGVPDLPNPGDDAPNYIPFTYNRQTSTGTELTVNVSVVPASVAKSASWTITPSNAVTAAPTGVVPTNKKGPQLQFKVNASAHPTYGTGGSRRRSLPLAYALEVTVCKDKPNEKTKRISFAQDQKDIIRQEYLNHRIRVPDRDSLMPVLPTADFRVTDMLSAYSLAWGQPINLAQRILNAWRTEMVRAHGGNEADYTLSLNSGWRNPERNEIVGGIKESKHQFGAAVDLAPPEGGYPGRATEAQAFCALRTAGLTVVSTCIWENGPQQVHFCTERTTISHVHCQEE